MKSYESLAEAIAAARRMAEYYKVNTTVWRDRYCGHEYIVSHSARVPAHASVAWEFFQPETER